LDVENGALPAELPVLDWNFVAAIASAPTIDALLPSASWETLEQLYGVSGDMLQPIRELWEPVHMLFSALSQTPRPTEVCSLMDCASFLQAYVVALLDAELFCEALRRRPHYREEAELVPVIGGRFPLVKVSNSHLKLLKTCDCIFGLQCKSGCIGPQIPTSVAQQKKELAAMLASTGQQGAGEGISGDNDAAAAEIPSELESDIAATPKRNRLPRSICSDKGWTQDCCNEAALIQVTLRAWAVRN